MKVRIVLLPLITKDAHLQMRSYSHMLLAGVLAAGAVNLPAPAQDHTEPERPYVSLKELRERGVVMQNWETSCAAATLATVLTYGLADAVTELQVINGMLKATDTATVKKQGGFSLLDMKHYVENRGYEGRAYQYLSLSDLRAFHAPIVPIVNYGYNHYIVFNGMKDDVVYLADPAFGNRKMRLAEFNKVWLDGMAFVVTQRNVR